MSLHNYKNFLRVALKGLAEVMIFIPTSAVIAVPLPAPKPSVSIVTVEFVDGGKYVEIDGALQGVVNREDGSSGTYKVPVSFSYPVSPDSCNNTGIVDVVNSVLYETSESAGTDSPDSEVESATLLLSQSFDREKAVATAENSLFAFAKLILKNDRFLRNDKYGGYFYAEVQWNKMVIDRQNNANTSPDPTYHIELGTDGYNILRDISAVVRDLEKYIDHASGGILVPTDCVAEDVIAFGHSQTGQLLRSFYMDQLNSALGNEFDDGLVFEGAIHSAAGGQCRRLDNSFPYYVYEVCANTTPASEGLVLAVNLETDVQILHGWTARSGSDPNYTNYYRAYEIAGTAHIPTESQNYIDISPVYRSLMDKLNIWIKDPSTPPPPPAWLTGQPKSVAGNLFSDLSWGNHTNQVYEIDVGPDYNTTGGVRLAHVDSTPPGGIIALPTGWPLGVYGGTDCLSGPLTVPTDPKYFPSYLASCHSFEDKQIYKINSGVFIPYQEFFGDDSLPERCGFSTTVDDSLAQITTAAQKGAELALAKGWILPEDVQPMVNSIVEKAKVLGCGSGSDSSF